MSNILGIIISYVFIGVIIVAAKFFEKAGKEASRKFIHIILCNWWFIAMHFFTNVVWAAIVPFSFIIINYISYKNGFIAVMEREDKEEEGLGTVYYAISLFILIIVSFGILDNKTIGLVGILIMGYGDGLAPIIGKSIKSKKYKFGKSTTKTIAGSITMFIVTTIILSIFLINTQFWYIKVLVAGFIIMLIEAISIKGTDNIFVPLIASFIYSVLI
ncbi:MAG: hypothetical protein HFJ53_00655 [Clostridia bacterium]|jgi:phytol kinase|nr:hypothetical protein [Clostridia bacterium]